MTGTQPRTEQLDTAEREHLEDVVVVEMRERVEDNVRYQLTQQGLDERPENPESLDEERRNLVDDIGPRPIGRREPAALVDAIELEAPDDDSWSEAFEQYVTGVGYTIVNRLAALRCMEVRGFLEEEVTVFKENGLTPAAETLVHEEFLLEDEAILAAYHEACDDLVEEIEILFDRSSAYSLIDPDDDTFEELCGMLDAVDDEVWRADDVLGWVYEYYNRPVVEALDAKNNLEPADVGPANQFYTPHWVVRMLTDNSLGKLYLEATGRTDSVPAAEARSPEQRKERAVTPEDAPTVPELCTYLIPDEEPGEAPEFDHPRELQVIDPACGSGHFLLYAFDVLERIWWAETDLDRAAIPAKILEHNLYGVDIDLRSCQLSAFNLYLKARTRAEAEGGTFEMPPVGIACADARVAELDEAADVLDEITGEGTDLRDALEEITEEFQQTEALGSLLDVSGTLEGVFERGQTDLSGWGEGSHQSLHSFLTSLRAAVDDRTGDSFGEQNLESFLHLLAVLTRDYDVSLMNPPYGSGGRMPDDVQEYVDEHYEYTTEYYINFFEACDRLTDRTGRTGMLVPWSFMFRESFQAFREAFIGGQGSFDYLAEFGYDVLDNAMVGTVGTVVRFGDDADSGTFIRLADVEKGEKEGTFLESAFVDPVDGGVRRRFHRQLDGFGVVPGAPLSYWAPTEIRELFGSDVVLDAEKADPEKATVGSAKVGLQTGNNARFVRYFWEHQDHHQWRPFAKGGSDAWALPRIKRSVLWGDDGAEVRRFPDSYPRNVDSYFSEALTYTVMKRSGRRFGYLHPSSVFGTMGSVFIPNHSTWSVLAYTNSNLFTYLMLIQTVERDWKRRIVARIPWDEQLETDDDLEAASKSAVAKTVSKRQYDLVSPHYTGPLLLAALGVDDPLPQYDHPHRELRADLEIDEPSDPLDTDAPLTALGTAATRHIERLDRDLQRRADAIDEAVFDCFGIDDEQRETILQEIALRTIEDPRERASYDPEAITEPGEAFPSMVKDLLIHFTLKLTHESDDGVVPITGLDGEDDLLGRIEREFERVWGEHAAARLAEVDDLLGSRHADEEAYPNLRAWLEEELFDYHVSTFDRTPIVWRLTTERLVSDPEGEGFGCLVDFHRLDDGLFDRLQNRYLEPRKARLRDRRAAASRRRDDDSLTASEQADAAETYARCESGLEQIEAFEDRLADLAGTDPRDWPAENQELATEAAADVAEFRDRTADRLATLETLADREDVAMGDLFSPSFYETVRENREEWLAALDDLEAAFEAYAAEGTTPVEPHHYDLFEYYDDLVGSGHYASNGILFMTYYFDQFDDAGQAAIGDGGAADRERLLAALASGLDEYEALADRIADACDEIAGDLPSDWAERARSEITTGGYRPNHKHGVEINVAPLADAEIVPDTVEDDVL